MTGKLMNHGDKPDGIPDNAWTLFCAAAAGSLPTIDSLIRSDPELIHYEIWYEFPIHFAVRTGQIEAVKLLLDAGSNPARSTFTYNSWQKLLPLAKEREFNDVHGLLIAEMKQRFNYDSDVEPLWKLIGAGDCAQVQQVIDNRPELINAGDVHGNRPLHWAVMCRILPIIKLLLDRGADIQALRADLQSPLHLAIEGDYWFRKIGTDAADATQEQVTRLLLDRGADYEFSVASATGDRDRVEELLATDGNLAKRLNASRRSPLYHASRYNHFEIVRLLLDHAADPNLPEESATRGKALFAACVNNNLQIVKLLLDHGADPNANVDSCGNCLSICDQNSDDISAAISRALREHGAREGLWLCDTAEKLSKRIQEDDSLSVDSIEWPAVLQSVLDTDSITTLGHFINRFGTDPIPNMNPHNGSMLPKSEKMLAELIANGLDVNRHDWYGKSFLHYAATDATTERAGWFLDSGINIDSVDRLCGTTALGIAAGEGNQKMVEFLLQRGASPNLPLDRRWAMPVTIATCNGFNEIAELLAKS